MHPDDMLVQLLQSASKRRRASLEIIHAVCREQHARGAKDFSIATIARLSEAKGGPTDSTIRNKTGEEYQGLIKCWASHTGGSPRKLPKPSEDPIMDLVGSVEKPEVRAILSSIVAENRKLKREVNLLKHQVSQTAVLDLRELPKSDATPTHAGELLPSPKALTPSEIDALRKAISPETLAGEGWKLDGQGFVVSDSGRRIYDIGYVSAIKKLIVAEKPKGRAR
jgi:hypothetical protein